MKKIITANIIILSLILTVSCVNKNEALTEALQTGDTDTAALMLRRRADPTIPDANGNIAIHWAARYPSVLVLLLPAESTMLDATNHDGNTPLHITAILGENESADILLNAGANPNLGNNDGETPLHLAAYYGNAELSEKLIENGADLEAGDHYLDTPLHEAALGEDLETVYRLIEAGADINAQNTDGATPLDYADDDDLTEYLIEAGARSGLEIQRENLFKF